MPLIMLLTYALHNTVSAYITILIWIYTCLVDKLVNLTINELNLWDVSSDSSWLAFIYLSVI